MKVWETAEAEINDAENAEAEWCNSEDDASASICFLYNNNKDMHVVHQVWPEHTFLIKLHEEAALTFVTYVINATEFM